MPTFGSISLVLLIFLAGTPRLHAASVGSIPPATAFADKPFTYVVNGSFLGRDLTYFATLADGSPLPYWLKLNAKTATFTALAPRSLSGKMYAIKLTATDLDFSTATTTFYLTVDYHSPDCVLDANTDRLAKILECRTGTVTLRGHSSTGIYNWTGPDGYTSTERHPVVSKPGIYVLLTTTTAGRTCARRSVIRVRPALVDCDGRAWSNRLPRPRIMASATEGEHRLMVQLDGTASYDDDGELLTYQWAWKGGAATGVRPVITFGVGTHEVLLTVTDDHGARATDRVTITVKARPEYTSFWLEAECGVVGENWATVYGNKVSGGVYLRPLLTSTSTAPADAPPNRVRLVVKDVKEGTYRLFARIDSKDTHSDSYWVRINEGEWFEWSSGIVKNVGFQWNMLRRDLMMESGTNVIELAYRERDTNLDKLYLTADGDQPSDLGGAAVNCRPNEVPIANANASTFMGPAPLATILNGSRSWDIDGAIVRYDWAWEGGSATGMQPQVSLPTGTHEITLTVTDEEGATGYDRILITATSPTSPPPPGNPTPVDPTPVDPTPTGPPPSDPTDDDETTGAPPPQPGIWLEAECAEVGSEWTTETAAAASSGKYVVALNMNATKAPPADVAANRIRFHLLSTEAATFHLYGRIDAPTNLDDSYWVRVNGGAWYKWYHAIVKGQGFQWNKMGASVKLRAGMNTIDFALRESGARLDKIYLSKEETTPENRGPVGTNCQQSVAYEAECAEVGSGWSTNTSAEVSGQRYVAFTTHRSLSTPSVANPAEEIKFHVTVSQAGAQHLFFRLNAPDVSSNSLWVRVDDGDWVKFWQEIGGAQLLTDGFEWRKVNHNGTDLTFDLGVGNHVITVANRETGTLLDKVQLSRLPTLPTDFGSTANNCVEEMPYTMDQMMSRQAVSNVNMTVEAPLALYPNPAHQKVHVELRSDYLGEVIVQVIDAHGRRLQRREFDKTGPLLKKKLEVANLPPGLYFVRTVTSASETTQSFVKQ